MVLINLNKINQGTIISNADLSSKIIVIINFIVFFKKILFKMCFCIRLWRCNDIFDIRVLKYRIQKHNYE